MSVVLNALSRAAFEWPCDSLKGRILRRSLRAVPKDLAVTVIAGPAKGLMWAAGAGPADFWLGDYEVEKAVLFARYTKPGTTVYDIGANVGFYTLIASRSIGANGQVIAFEPSPRNLGYLRRHLDLNCTSNVRIVEVAITDSEGMTRFLVGKDHRTSQIAGDGDIDVRTTSLDMLMNDLPWPDVIEMDIEGAELSALRGAHELLRKASPVIFLSTHGREIHRGCCELLTRLGYELHSIGSKPIEDTDELLCAKPRS